MKRMLIVLTFICSSITLLAQNISGRLVDDNGSGLTNINLKMYISNEVYNTVTVENGAFNFDLTNVEDNGLPKDYFVSNNFPNPFNPATRICITLPKQSRVKVSLFNILGQIAKDEIEYFYEAGSYNIDLELNGMANGMYIARIIIDGKFVIVRKLMLLYGSQHLDINENPNVILLDRNEDSSIDITIDSLIAENKIIGRKAFLNLSLPENNNDLGDLIVERYCSSIPVLDYEGIIYNTIRIGNQCWLKENLNIGVKIDQFFNSQLDNNIIEKYCYLDDENNCEKYGGLYEWNETMQYSTSPGSQGICPSGWHIPTLEEFQTLSVTVNNESNPLKMIGQGTGEGTGTNTSGFSALLAGSAEDGSFYCLGTITNYWTSSEYDAIVTHIMNLTHDTNTILYYISSKFSGISVRCIKDE